MNADNRRDLFAPGMTIADRFELLRPLGKGTMGSLWVAHHKTLDVDLALKFIDPELVDRADLRSRFAQEAMAAAKIRSPHVVSVLDFGEAEGSQPYIAMELLEGESLSARLERDVRLPLPDTARMLVHASKGLAKAHAHGIVHRDLKPENLFLSEDEDEDGFVLKILDFGIAKASAPTTGVLHRTLTGQLVGTPLYMSPEQAVSNPAAPSSDLYSLASVAYHCLTGSPVFEVENIALLLVSLATKEPPPLSKHLPDAPQELEAWFRKALHKDPEQRFESARQLAESFTAACQVSGAGSLGRLSLPSAPGLRAGESWGEVTPPPVPHFSTPVLRSEATTEPPAAPPARTASAKAASPDAGDTLVDEAIKRGDDASAPFSPPTSASARVQVLDSAGSRSDLERGSSPALDAAALGFAPTIRDQSGAIRDMVERAAAEGPGQNERSLPQPAAVPTPTVERGLPLVGEGGGNRIETLMWIIGAVVAVGAAVAVGWLIGRSL